jgi:hypothetical protein
VVYEYIIHMYISYMFWLRCIKKDRYIKILQKFLNQCTDILRY